MNKQLNMEPNALRTMTRHVRGTHILNLIDYVRSKKGSNGVDELWDRLEEKRGSKKKEIKENEFVEYDLLLDLFEIVEELHGEHLGVSRPREIGRHIANNLGYYEFLMRADSFEELIRKAEDSWDQVYDFGSIELVEYHDDAATIRYHGYPKDHRICDYFQGSLEADIELMDMDGEIEHTACPVQGDEYIEFRIHWG